MTFKKRFADSSLAVFLAFLLVYLLTLTSNFTGPHDSMAYLEMLQNKDRLWHPHHLIYHKLSYLWLHLLKPVFPDTADYFLVESFGSLFGAATLSIVFLFFRRRFLLPVAASWLGTAIVGFSYGIWFYSVNVEVYAPSLLFTMWTLYVATRKNWSAKDVWLAALLQSVAILFHQMNILITPVIIYKIYEQRKNIYVLKSIFWYGLTGLVIVGGAYFITGWILSGHNSFDGWIGWIKGYTSTGQYWRGLNLKTPALAGIGFSHTIFGGHFIFEMGLQNELSTLLSTHELQDEAFLVRHMSTSTGTVLFIFASVIAMCILFMLVNLFGRVRFLVRNQYHIVIPLLIYFGVTSFYFLFWMPEILEFWLGQCIVFWMLLIGGFQPQGRRFNILLLAVAVMLFSVNYFSSIRPMQNIKNDIGYERIQKVRSLATEKDLVVVRDPWLLKDFLEYYTPATVLVVPVDEKKINDYRQAIRNKLNTGGKIFLFTATSTIHASPNASFIPSVIEEHKSRTTLLQKEMTEIWMIK